MQISTTIMEHSMGIPQKAEDRSAIQPRDTTPGNLPNGTKMGYSRDTCTLMSIAAYSQ
jgi:hypothetical protein